MILPGYVRDIKASAAEDEEAARRLDWQKERGYILQYEEFAERVKEAVVQYENRNHAGLKHSPLDELRLAGEQGWSPTWIDPKDIRHIFLESDTRVVRGNRVQIADTNYVGPALTRQMIAENRHDLAGLSGRKVEVLYDPDDLETGAWVVDPRDGQYVYLTPEKRIDPFNAEALSEQLAEKRSSIKAVTGVYRDAAAAAGKVLRSSAYKPRIEAQAAAEKAITDKAVNSNAIKAMSDADFGAAIASRLAGERSEQARRQPVYATPTKRYQAILDTIIRGEEPSLQDKLYKASYESRMGDEEKMKWQIYFDFNSPDNRGKGA
jgi:putative transposase